MKRSSRDLSIARKRQYIEGRVFPEPMSGCWFWMGYVAPDGYGKAKLSRRSWFAHRLAYEAYRGPIPDGMVIDHLCRVRCCVNADHLEAVTRQENERRGLHGVFSKHCKRGHPWDEKQMARVGTGKWRWCKTCKKEVTRRWLYERGGLAKAAATRREWWRARKMARAA